MHPTSRWRRQTNGGSRPGVASGIAHGLGVEAGVVRLAFAVLTLVSGVGVVLYLVAWVLMPADDGRGALALQYRRGGRTDIVRGAALGAIVLGVALLLRRIGAWVPDRLLWPTVLVSAGLAMVWQRSPGTPALLDDEPATPRALAVGLTRAWTGSGRRSIIRVAAGVVLVLAGAGAFLAANGSLRALRQGLIGGVVLAAGLGLILGPWLVRLSGELGAERRARIRSEAQSEFAAHLHDSVLQTLAIIQRRADQPREVVALARRQERELRAWMYGGTAARAVDEATTLGEALEAAAAEVEALHGVRVEVVKVGDCPVDERVGTAVQAAREAMVNAATHAQVDEVSVYAEVEGRKVEVFVRDRGVGFDPATVPSDRRGMADSIRARVERIGGTVRVHTELGTGTEVHLTVTRSEP